MLRTLLRTCALAAAAASLTCASAAPAAPSPSPSHRVIETLLSGGDARAAIAQARADGTPSKSTVLPRRDGAMAGYARQLQRVGDLVAKAQNDASAVPALRDALADLRARRLLVETRLDTIDRTLAERGTPSRWTPQRTDVVAFLARVDAAAVSVERALATLGKNATVPHAALSELADLAAANADENRAPVYGANLPVHRPRLPAREPTLAPVVVPAYANAETEIDPTAADVAANADAPFSAEILAKAASLGHDYARIVDFVRSQVRTQWYAGAQKGAQGTLRTLAGNDVDQASLLIALLRASRAPARYVQGVLEVPVADLAASLAVRTDKVGQALAAAGIAHKPVARGGRIAAYAIEHVFVTARLPLSNYRGTSADLDGETWIPLAPALKPHRFVPARGALAATNVSARTFADEYVRNPQTLAPLDALRERVTQALTSPYVDQLAQHAVDAPPLELLPTSLPSPTLAVTGEFAQLPEALRQRVRIVVDDGNGGTALDTTLPLQDLVDRRVTLAYLPASIEDGNLADRYGGLGNVPPSLIDVRPVLNLAGQPAQHGRGAVENGARHRVEVTITGPAGSTSFAQELTAGGLAALVFDAQSDGPALQADGTTLPGESESPAAKLLANLGARYLAAWDDADNELARLIGVGVVRPFPSAVLVINRLAVTRVAGVVDAMPWDGVALDAALRPVEAFAGIAENRAESDWTELSALHGSALEHHVFEQQWAVDSVSADKGLALAVAQNIPLLQLTSATGVSGLNQPQSVKEAIAAWLARGYVVDVPRDPLTHHAWTGAVWRVRALATGESGYFIAGNLAGGATAMPPALWYLQELAELLGNPYAELPNDDPLAAAILTIDRSSQDQQGEAGTELPKRLRAMVADTNGRPVRNAEVLFSVTNTGSVLIDAQGLEAGTALVKTDGRGFAEVRLKLGTSLDYHGEYRLLPNQQYPQWTALALVEVVARSRNGAIASGEAFRAAILPGAPAVIRLVPGGALTLTPNLGFTDVTVFVRDRYENAVANVPVDINAATVYPPSSCNGAGPPVSPIAGALFEPGQCPRGTLQLTGNTCTTPQLQVVSRAQGAPVSVVPANVTPATVTVTAAFDSVNASMVFPTSSSFQFCGIAQMFVVSTWSQKPMHGYSFLGRGIDAARPNTLVPEPKRIDIQYANLDLPDGQQIFWHPLSQAPLQLPVSNGSAENVREEHAGAYFFDLRAGPQPGKIDGDVVLASPVNLRFAGAFGAWSVDPRAPDVVPASIGLTPFARTERDFALIAGFRPADYFAAPLRIELLKDGEVLNECAQFYGDASYSCAYARGMPVDPEAEYTARTVINDGTPFRMQSDEAPVTFGANIVAGYRMLPGDVPDPLDLVRIVQGEYPTSISLRTEIDVPTGYTCTVGERFGFLLSRAATVTLGFWRADSTHGPALWEPLRNETRDAGLHDVMIDTAHLPPGEYEYLLKVVANDGTTEEYRGNAGSKLIRRDALPLAHSLVKGVDVFSGNAAVTEDDIVVGGRGPGMRLVRSYASHQAGDEPGVFGRGWSADLDNQVITTGCNERIVTGGGGQGQRFAPVRDPDGTQRFVPMHGYHGTLVQRGAEYDFYAKDGTRYHFGGAGVPGPRLAYVEDTNGNRVVYTWQFDQLAPRVTRIADASGRQIDLVYATRSIDRPIAGTTVRESQTLIESARGPDGLVVRYEYDTAGNLAKVTRSDASGKGTRVSVYEYHDFKGLLVTQPDQKSIYTHFGHRLIAARDGASDLARTYTYEIGWSAVPNGNETYYQPEQRVATLTEPDDGVTTFAYTGQRGTGPVETAVTDARTAVTTYRLNRYGAADGIVAPSGTTTTEWDLAAVQPKKTTDALGTTTTWVYDTHGNKQSEEIAHASGTRTRTWTYVPTSEFDVPYVRNRVDRYTDARHIVTDYDYDRRGNVTTTKRGGVSQTDGYEPNGDRTTHTDGRGKVWKFRYDRHGYPAEVENPLSQVAKTTYDARGRKLSETDANGGTTTREYDARDRVLRTEHPSTAAGAAIENIAYDDAERVQTRTSARGYVVRSVFDPMGRLLDEVDNVGTRSREYDKNGNLEREVDREGHATRYEYDESNRLRKKFEPENRTTLYDVDALGHVTGETVGDRATEYRYDDPEYRRTEVRRRLADASGGRWLVEVTRYDENGNAIETIDPLQRTTLRSYDARDRLERETAPLGKVATYVYDGADNKIVETRENAGGSGTQRRTFRYDDAGRLIESTDAESFKRTIAYDANGNVVETTDARGSVVRQIYDARNNLVERSGPEAGQRTTYAYDRHNNKVRESRPNGRVLTYRYDVLDRLDRTEDADGLVEARVLDKDGLVVQLIDADNRETVSTYDGLHRVRTKTLPGAGPRRTTLAYGVHPEPESSTDARGYATTFVHDTLGRRIETRHPAVAGVTAVEKTTYDDAGNVATQTNGRGDVTEYTVNALNQRIGQKDPADAEGRRFEQSWTYDALGNTLTHTDRRGVLGVTAYDKENRVVGRARGGLVLETLTFDAEGNVRVQRDALGRETHYAYDKANRKTRQEAPLGAVTTWTYTPEGDIASLTDADGRTTTHTYTKRRYMETQELAGETTTYRYNGSGQRSAMQRPEGDEWLYGYDAGGRLATVESPRRYVTTYGYDAADNRTSVEDANRHTTTFRYDARNRLEAKVYAGGAEIAWTYDADGNKSRTTTPNGRAIDTTHDALNRAVETTYAGAVAGEASKTTRRYDANGNTVRIDEVVDGATRTETRRYDDFDRLEHVVDTLGRTLTYGYDDAGNRTRLVDHGGLETTWSYNALNQNDAVTVPGQGTTTQTHTKAGLIDVVTRPDGSTSDTDYDPAGRIARAVHAKAGQTLASYAYRYDFNGNRVEQKETNGAVTGGSEIVTTYGYDADDRLETTTAPERTTTYTLDAVGNRTSERVVESGTTVSHSTLTYDARDRLTTRADATAGVDVVQTYDDNGNLKTQTVNGVARTYTYDTRDRLVKLEQVGNAPLMFDYDAQGRRLAKTQGAQSTYYQYDQGSLHAETNAIGNAQARYHYSANQLLAETKGSSTPVQRHFLLDALKTPIALLTQQGAVSARTRYDAWGEIVAQQGTGGATTTPPRDGAYAVLPATDEQPFGFTGYYKDGESGLYYAKARYYDPAVARFTTEDPAAGTDMTPPSLHRYLYAYANPTAYVDTTGAYSESGHYYTTYYVALRVGFDPKTAQQLAYYSQVPDEVDEWDAIATQVDYVPFMNNPLLAPKLRGVRNTVQMDMHVLTNEPSEIVTPRVQSAIVAANYDIPTTGFLLHSLGDSFAHRRSGWKALDANTYWRGLGHLFDSLLGRMAPWTGALDPDLIQNRPDRYLAYVDTLARTLGKVKGKSPLEISTLSEELRSGDELGRIAYLSRYEPRPMIPGPLMTANLPSFAFGIPVRRDDAQMKELTLEAIRTMVHHAGGEVFDTPLDKPYAPEIHPGDDEYKHYLPGAGAFSIAKTVEQTTADAVAGGVRTDAETARKARQRAVTLMEERRRDDEQRAETVKESESGRGNERWWDIDWSRLNPMRRYGPG